MICESSRRARQQIEEIVRYTDSTFGQEQTQDYITGLYYSFRISRDNPKMGMRYDDRRRRYIYRSHQVYYRLFKARIVIVDIRSSRQSPLQR